MNTSLLDSEGFRLSPVSLNITVNAVAVFHYQHPIAVLFAWKMNGTLIDQTISDFPEGVTIDCNISIVSLTIVALLEYNQARIQCMAFFADLSK